MSKLKKESVHEDARPEMMESPSPDIISSESTEKSSTERESDDRRAQAELERLPENESSDERQPAENESDDSSDAENALGDESQEEMTDERQPAESDESQEDELMEDARAQSDASLDESLSDDSTAASDELEQAQEESQAGLPDDAQDESSESESRDDASSDAEPVDESDESKPAQPAESDDPENPLIKICVSTKKPSRKCTRWKNVEMTFNELCERLSHPIETDESFYDYQNSEKTDQIQAKDQGGFVGGYLTDEKKNRSIANMSARTLFTTDIDECTPEVFDAIESMIDYRATIDTSHSHSPAEPRFRIIAPLNRECSVDEYPIMAMQLNRELRDRMTEFLLEFHGVTEISDLEKLAFPDKEVIKDAARIIFWTSKSVDGEFIHKETHKPLIDVDAVLKRYRGEIHDEKAQKRIAHRDAMHDAFAEFDAKNKNYPDPRVMDGIEGLFNRAYTLPDVLRIFLSDVYTPSADPRRYSYKKGSSEKGLSLLSDYVAFSHHATDPANNGKPLSPFWIVCIHRYGEDKKAALKALRRDKGVIAQIAKERSEAHNLQAMRDQFPLESKEWQQELKTNEKGEFATCTSNCTIILENDPLFANIARNEMSGRIEITGDVPWIRKMPDSKRKRKDIFARAPKQWLKEDDRASILVLLDKFYAPFTPWMLDYALRDVAAKRRFHPMRDFIENLPEWDGTDRITDLLPKAFNARACDYTAAVMRKVLCAMITKAYDPYAEFQYVMVLDGKQGIGKSSFLRWLVGDRFFMSSLTLGDMQSKAAAEKIQDYVAVEIPEFGGMRKADQEIVKGFITNYCDVYRAAFAHEVEEKPRGCILLGTVNGERGILKDITGGRRWWMIKCHLEGHRIWDKLFDEDYRLQIWAQALKHYEDGEKLEMDTPELDRAALNAQRDSLEVDDRRGQIERFLEMLLPDNWKHKDIEERQEYLKAESHYDGIAPLNEVCAMEIYQVVFKGDLLKGDRKAQNEIALCMKSLPNWEYVESPKDFPPFGKQRYYRRIKTEASQLAIHEDSSVDAQPPVANDPSLSHSQHAHPFIQTASLSIENPPIAQPAAAVNKPRSLSGYLREKFPIMHKNDARDADDVSNDFVNEHERDKKLAAFATRFFLMHDLIHEAAEIVERYAKDFDSLASEDFVNVFNDCDATLPPSLRGKWRAGIDNLIAG